jgi:3-dehydroquinate synthase
VKEIIVNTGRQKYPIIIEPHGLSQIGYFLRKNCLSRSAAIITDETVGELYSSRLMKSLDDAGIRTHLITIPDGEASKALEYTNSLYTALIETNLCRDDCIIALGGGVVGDLAGFTSATYLRGIAFIQITTSLLAQVDSSVGGKVGINHPLGKNLIGSFYQPKYVLIDPELLLTLAEREIWAGLGEVAKYGFIIGERFFGILEKNLEKLASLSDIYQVSEMIAACCQYKATIVRKDEKESGERRILNLGHTLGHALEAVTKYEYFKHGEAVIYGIHWAIWVSYKKQYLNESEVNKMTSFLRRFPIPSLPDIENTKCLLSKMNRDKKQTGNGLYIVLLKGFGKIQIEKVDDVSVYIEEWLDSIQ